MQSKGSFFDSSNIISTYILCNSYLHYLQTKYTSKQKMSIMLLTYGVSASQFFDAFQFVYDLTVSLFHNFLCFIIFTIHIEGLILIYNMKDIFAILTLTSFHHKMMQKRDVTYVLGVTLVICCRKYLQSRYFYFVYVLYKFDFSSLFFQVSKHDLLQEMQYSWYGGLKKPK